MKAKTVTRLVGQVAAGNGITVVKAAGVFTVSVNSGAGIFQLADADLTALAALTGTGIARRTGAGAWSVGTTVSAIEGGTGQTSYTVGDLLYASTTTALSKLAAGISGYLLQANGAGIAPSYQGFVQAGTGAATRTWQAKARDQFNVKDFGALGDSTGAGSTGTDDTAAIQAAIAAAYAAKITTNAVATPTVYFPFGAYKFTGITASLAGAIKFKGDGPRATQLYLVVNTAKAAIQCAPSVYQSGLVFEDLTLIDPSGTGVTGVGNIGIEVQNNGSAVFKNVHIFGFRNAIKFTASYAPQVTGCEFARNLGSALLFTADQSGNAAKILTNNFFGNGASLSQPVIDINGVDPLIQGNDIEGNYAGILYRGVIAGSQIGNYFENNTSYDFNFASGALSNAGFTITGNGHAANSPDQTFTDVTDVTVEGNSLYDGAGAIAWTFSTGTNGLKLGNNVLLNGSSISMGVQSIALRRNTITLTGATSGFVDIATQAAAGAATLTLPTGTGTLASSASAPVVLNSTTGALTLSGTMAQFDTACSDGNFLYSGGSLGTPSGGTATNLTGLPVAGITASTITALGVGSLELGHASDTTLSRSASGQVQIEGVNIATAANALTLTNKTIASASNTLTICAAWSSFHAHKNGTNQTGIANDTWTQVTFGTEVYDTGSNFASSAWTPPAGKVRMIASVNCFAGSSINGYVVVSIYKNGTSWKVNSDQTFMVSQSKTVTVIADDDANGTDVYTVYAFITSGTTSSLSGNAGYSFFMGSMIQ